MSGQYLSPLHDNLDLYQQQVPQYIIRQEKQQHPLEAYPYSQPQDLRALQSETQGGYYRIAREPQQEQLIYAQQPDFGQSYILQQPAAQQIDLGLYSSPLSGGGLAEVRRYNNESLVSSPGARGRSVHYLQAGAEPVGQPYLIQQQFVGEPQYQEQYVVQREFLPQAQLQQQVQYGALGAHQGLLAAGPVPQQAFVEQVPVQGSRRHSFGLGGMNNSAFMQKSVINAQRSGAWDESEGLSRNANSKFNRDGRGIFILGKGRLGLEEEKSSKYDGWDNYDDNDQQGRGGRKARARPERREAKRSDQWGISPQRAARRSSNPMTRSLTQTFFGGEDPTYRNQQMINSQILGRQGPAQLQEPYYVNNQRLLVGGEPQLIQQQPQQNVIYVTRQQEEYIPRATVPAQEYIIQREVQPQLIYQGQQGPQVREYVNVIPQPERQAYLLPQEGYQFQGASQFILPQDNIQLIETQGGVQYLKANENLGLLYSPSRSVQRVQENMQYIQSPQLQQLPPQFVSNQQTYLNQQPQQQIYSQNGENVQYVTRSVINQEPVTYVRREVVQNGGDQQGFISQNFQSSGQIASSQILSGAQTNSYAQQYGNQNPSQSGNLNNN